MTTTTTTVTVSTTTTVTTTTVANFVTDADLVKIRPNVLSLGVATWKNQCTEATRQISRVIEARWYNERAADHGVDYLTTPFDPSKLDLEQIRNLACFKALELAYLYLMKDGPMADGFERENEIFRKLYKEELSDLFTAGISYDWNADDEHTGQERLQPRIRRLQRV